MAVTKDMKAEIVKKYGKATTDTGNAGSADRAADRAHQ